MDMADKAVLYSCLCFFREFGEVGAAKPDVVRLSEEAQPPLGGCVLKLFVADSIRQMQQQPPLGGCVLKLKLKQARQARKGQPPLGGCVLKHWLELRGFTRINSRL